MATVLLGLTIIGVGVRLALTGGYISPAGRVPENRSFERTDEEELVKRYILNNADKDADRVKFLTWGPHMDKRELLDLASEGGIAHMAEIFGPLGGFSLPVLDMSRDDWINFLKDPIQQTTARAIIRVRYEGPPTLHRRQILFQIQLNGEQPASPLTYDDLFVVTEKRVIPFDEKGGDDWKQKLRKELSKRFPALKP